MPLLLDGEDISWIILILVVVIGWVSNIVELCVTPISTEFWVILMAAIVWPVGVIMGWVNILS